MGREKKTPSSDALSRGLDSILFETKYYFVSSMRFESGTVIGIVAYDVVSDRGLGRDGKMAWHVPEDMLYFKHVTTTSDDDVRNIVIVGSVTYRSLPKGRLPGRRLFVIQHTNNNNSDDNVEFFTSPMEAIQKARSEMERTGCRTFVAGGESIYRALLSECDYISATELFLKPDAAAGYDRHFPNLNDSEWQLVETGQIQMSSNVERTPYRVMIYKRHVQEMQYLDLLRRVRHTGFEKMDRTGVGTVSSFGEVLKFDLSTGEFPLLTTKKVFMTGVVEELLWFLRGDTNAKNLSQRKVKIWDGNSSRAALDRLGFPEREEGDCGPIYGFQWRNFDGSYHGAGVPSEIPGIDQMDLVLKNMREKPNDRRHLVIAWNPKQLKDMCLPPCHVCFQFGIRGDIIDLAMFQRSADLFLGTPFNIASYALLLHMACFLLNKTPGTVTIFMSDAHVYRNHFEAVDVQLTRRPHGHFPRLSIAQRGQQTWTDFIAEDFKIENYVCYPAIPAPMAV